MSRGIKSAVLTAVVCLVVCISSVQAEEMAIGIKPDAGESERFAAEQLQSYLEKITGQKVPVGAKVPEGATALLVGGGAGCGARVHGGRCAGGVAFGSHP